jgi:hypothetical protein
MCEAYTMGGVPKSLPAKNDSDEGEFTPSDITKLFNQFRKSKDIHPRNPNDWVIMRNAWARMHFEVSGEFQYSGMGLIRPLYRRKVTPV